MEKKIFSIISTFGFILLFAGGALCEMSSANYRIPTSVLSGGGAPMASTSFQIDSTLGQPSPLMDPANPPYSTNYDLYPGFWHNVAAEPMNACEGDFNEDGDVDGSDLAVFAADFVDGSDLAVFAANFGRTDCP